MHFPRMMDKLPDPRDENRDWQENLSVQGASASKGPSRLRCEVLTGARRAKGSHEDLGLAEDP